MSGVDVVVRYRRGYTYGHHAVLGALEVEPPPGPHDVHLCRSAEEVTAQIEASLALGRRVLVAWSFYSPDAAAMASELADVRAALTAHGHGPDIAGHGPGVPLPHDVDQRVLHVAGGVHATAEPLVTLRAGWDVVAVGEGERTFTALVAAVATGTDWRGLPGTTHLAPAHGNPLDSADPAATRLVKGPPAVRRDLDAYPPFPYRRNMTSPIEITRGCVYACAF